MMLISFSFLEALPAIPGAEDFSVGLTSVRPRTLVGARPAVHD